MLAAVEISMYPLLAEYEKPILDFIKRMNQYPELRVETNSMSTQIFGEYDLLMRMLSQEMKKSFEEGATTVMVMKVLVAG